MKSNLYRVHDEGKLELGKDTIILMKAVKLLKKIYSKIYRRASETFQVRWLIYGFQVGGR